METTVFLDARTKSNSYRITAFSDSVEDLARQYQNWAKECEVSQKNIWYANIFDLATQKHIWKMVIGKEYEITVLPTPKSRINPFRKSLSQLIDRIRPYKGNQ